MIEVTRFNSTTFYVNAELIELVEETPDTVITLSNGHKYVVEESAKIVMQKIIEYRNKVFSEVKFSMKKVD